MDTKSAKKGSLADAPSADADIARAEHSLSQQSTSKGLSSALPDNLSPAARETPDKREASGTLPMLNVDRQSAEPAADAGLGDYDDEEKPSRNDYDDAGGLPAIASVRSGIEDEKSALSVFTNTTHNKSVLQPEPSPASVGKVSRVSDGTLAQENSAQGLHAAQTPQVRAVAESKNISVYGRQTEQHYTSISAIYVENGRVFAKKNSY